jgi:hypothetical protein
VQLEGLGQSKNPMTSPGIEPETFRLVSQCLDQLRYNYTKIQKVKFILILIEFMSSLLKFIIIITNVQYLLLFLKHTCFRDRLCGLVVRVLGYRSGGPGSIPGTTKIKSSGSGTGSAQSREYN